MKRLTLFLLALTVASQGWGQLSYPGQQMDRVRVKGINKTIFVDQMQGATADVQFSNACALLGSSGGILDARGFGATTQSVAATVSCGSATQPVTFLFDPSTAFQPSGAALTLFQYSAGNYWSGLHIDTTNQASYSGNAIQNWSNTQGVSRITIANARVDLAAGATGACFAFVGTANGQFSEFSNYDITCNPGANSTAKAAIVSVSGTNGGFFNSNFLKITVPGVTTAGGAANGSVKYCLDLAIASGSNSGTQINSNDFIVNCEANTQPNALAAVHGDNAGGGTGSVLISNRFYVNWWDPSGSNPAVLLTNTNVCDNEFKGLLTNGFTDPAGCSNLYYNLGSTTTITSSGGGYGLLSGSNSISGLFVLGRSSSEHQIAANAVSTGFFNDALPGDFIFRGNTGSVIRFGTQSSGNSAMQIKGSRFQIRDMGTCTMTAGACTAQNLDSTYAAAPKIWVQWTGTGTCTGILKYTASTTQVTPQSSVGTDTCQVNWFAFGQ